MISHAVEVRAARSPSEREAWLEVPRIVMGRDPAWVAPLALQERRRISAHNPFFTFGEAELFVAWRSGRPVGRISAHVNRRHLERHQDATGHFGFFDCEDDQVAASGLVETAADWLRSRGLKRMVGPLSFSINEEVGLLVKGFETPAAILMGHAAPWSGSLLERADLAKEIDTFAYRMRPSDTPPIIARLAGLAARSPGVKVRPFDMRNYRAEIATLIDIYNDAWSDNWGFVPFADAEIDALISETRFLLRGRYGRLLELDGEPVGVMLALPDLNDAIRGFDGRLLPFNWGRLLGTYATERWRSARVPLLGLRRSLRGSPLAPSLLALLVAEFMKEWRRYPLENVEFSWVLETNRAMTTLAELAAGPPVKTYRVYKREL